MSKYLQVLARDWLGVSTVRFLRILRLMRGDAPVTKKEGQSNAVLSSDSDVTDICSAQLWSAYGLKLKDVDSWRQD